MITVQQKAKNRYPFAFFKNNLHNRGKVAKKVLYNPVKLC